MSTTTTSPVVRDPRGLRWTRVPTAADRTGAPVDSIHKWVRRDRVRSVLLDRARWVCLDDVEEAERERAARARDTEPTEREGRR